MGGPSIGGDRTLRSVSQAGSRGFEPRLPFRSSPNLCRKWAEVMVAAQAAGRRIETADAWIAATALLYDAPLVTHNGSDYLGVPGLKLISHG